MSDIIYSPGSQIWWIIWLRFEARSHCLSWQWSVFSLHLYLCYFFSMGCIFFFFLFVDSYSSTRPITVSCVGRSFLLFQLDVISPSSDFLQQHILAVMHFVCYYGCLLVMFTLLDNKLSGRGTIFFTFVSQCLPIIVTDNEKTQHSA